ncbi:MAG TPA: stage II sporulation protein M [Bryobacteraceae bacterium]|nr:stage II sporulation protein M [Bryobacteraceae bacterium]
MIVDLARFVETERPHWVALEKSLDWLAAAPSRRLTIEEAQRFHELYQRTAADLARMSGFAAEGELRRYLEWLVSRAYSEIHETRERKRFRPWRLFTVEFPRAFRRHLRAFQLTVALTVLGVAFGGLAVEFDPEAKGIIMPFEGLQITPSERVAKELKDQGRHLTGVKGRFSAMLMTHNTQVALTTIALGASFGFGTVVVLFYNGVTMGAVIYDYVRDGQSTFLMGWLLPHGVIEIPAILVGGQAGLVIAYALIGWGSRLSRTERLRRVSRDVMTLAAGTAIMLIWAGLVESFLSQYHEPVIRYGWKIGFGLVEATLLTLFLARAGRGEDAAA